MVLPIACEDRMKELFGHLPKLVGLWTTNDKIEVSAHLSLLIHSKIQVLICGQAETVRRAVQKLERNTVRSVANHVIPTRTKEEEYSIEQSSFSSMRSSRSSRLSAARSH